MNTWRGCPNGQSRIYYLGGNDLSSIAKSPNLEIFRRKGIEVLFLTDPIDEFALNSLHSYQGKELTSIDSADLDLPETGPTIETEPDAKARARARRAGSAACSICSGRRWAIGSARFANRSD